MTTFTSIINRWSSINDMANDLNIPPDHVVKWKKRKNIPPKYWMEMLVSAKRRKIKLSGMELIKAAARL